MQILVVVSHTDLGGCESYIQILMVVSHTYIS